jgi:hypothetical protein
MSRSGQGAGRPLGNTAAGSSKSAAQPVGLGFAGKAALGLVGLGVVGHVLRSPRFHERVVVGVIVVGALRGLGQENRANTFARLTAWNKRQMELIERKTERQAAHLALKAERQTGRLERKARRQARRMRTGDKAEGQPA